MNNGASIDSLPFDPELSQGAHNAVFVCLRVQPEEKVTLITDEACKEIAASLVAELTARGCRHRNFILEDLAPRPLVDMPQVVLDDLATSQVSIFAVQAQMNELKTRMQMCNVVNQKKIRHAHMVNIEKKIMLEGMRADFQKVDELTLRVMNIVNSAKQIRATTPAGTDITADLTATYKWIKTSAKYGDLAAAPLTLTVKENRLTEASSKNKELEHEFWQYTHRDGNSDRVGEFAIGTNLALSRVVGNILQDEKIPGVHMAFGDPYGAHTGAQWTSTTHIDVVGQHFDIWADDLQIMSGGKFLV